MNNAINKATACIEAIEKMAEKMNADDVEDEFAYDFIFGMWSKRLEPTLESIGINHSWYDPDTTYKEDVNTFVGSLEEVKEKLVAVKETLDNSNWTW